MPLPKYEKHENDFLEAMATRFCFTGKTRLVFVKRFREQYAEWNDKTLADDLEVDLQEGTKKKDAAIVLRDRLEAICNKLEDEGCDFGDTERGRWKIGKAWLQEFKFPKWAKEQGLIVDPPLNLDQLWNQLKAKATRTNKMGVVLAPVEPIGTMGMLPKKPRPYRDTVPLDSDICFKANFDKEGYLILLEYAPSGAVFCVCPSQYAPESRCQLGETTLPQYPHTFKAWEEGKEQLLAIISQELPPLEWLGKSKEEALELEGVHLKGLLDYLERVSASEVFYTEYLVTA